MRIFYLILLTFFVPLSGFAAVDEVRFTSSQTVQMTISGTSYSYTVDAGSFFDSMTVNDGDMSFIMNAGAQAIIRSANRHKFTVSPSLAQESFSCSSSESQLNIRLNSPQPQTTVTITPEATACSSGGGGGGGGGGSGGSGGGGGGGGAAASVSVAPAAPVSTQVAAAVVAATPAPSVASPVAQAVSPVFTKVLKKGFSNPDVKRLQQLLNADPDTRIASSGVGSPGSETEFYGKLTEDAVKKFQVKHGIVSSGTPETTGYGLVGPKTQAKIEEVFGAVSTAPAATPSAPAVSAQPAAVSGVSPVFSKGIGRSASNSDVKRLQQLLNADPDTRIASSGVGSPGSETEFYGKLTEDAVKKFQVKHGIAGPGEAGYGYVGPKTRAKIEEVFSAVPAAPATPTAPAAPVTPAPVSASTEDVQAQIEAALKKVQELQAQLQLLLNP